MGIITNVTISRTKGPDFIFTGVLRQPKGSCRVNIFRHSRSALPPCENGIVLLLCSFRVQTFARENYLKSQSDSCWGSIEGNTTKGLSEIAREDIVHARELQLWWTQQGCKKVQEPRICGQMPLAQLAIGTVFDFRGKVVHLPDALVSPFVLVVTDPSQAAFKLELRLQDARFALRKLRPSMPISIPGVIVATDDEGLYGYVAPLPSGVTSIEVSEPS